VNRVEVAIRCSNWRRKLGYNRRESPCPNYNCSYEAMSCEGQWKESRSSEDDKIIDDSGSKVGKDPNLVRPQPAFSRGVNQRPHTFYTKLVGLDTYNLEPCQELSNHRSKHIDSITRKGKVSSDIELTMVNVCHAISGTQRQLGTI